MRHRKKTIKLDRSKSVRDMMLRNMATSLIIHEKIKTTKAKAKALQPIMDKLVTIAKVNNLTSRRRLLSFVFDNKAVVKMLDVIGKRYNERSGGYTRIVNIGRRVGDGAEVSQIEFV